MKAKLCYVTLSRSPWTDRQTDRQRHIQTERERKTETDRDIPLTTSLRQSGRSAAMFCNDWNASLTTTYAVSHHI